MRLNRQLALGFAVGAVFAIIVVLGLFVWMNHRVKQSTRTDLFVPVRGIPEPMFPDIAQVHDYGAADSNWSFQSLDGKQLRLSDLRGKVVFLHFWATWCAGCLDELPFISSLQDHTRNLRVSVVLLSEEDPQKIRKFLSTFHFSSLPAYVATEKSPSIFQVYELPSTFIIDKNGEVVYRHLGYAPWGEKCVQFLTELSRAEGKPN
jgi:thiol-disulfide isomerase/thioredoxin